MASEGSGDTAHIRPAGCHRGSIKRTLQTRGFREGDSQRCKRAHGLEALTAGLGWGPFPAWLHFEELPGQIQVQWGRRPRGCFLMGSSRWEEKGRAPDPVSIASPGVLPGRPRPLDPAGEP